MISILQNVIYSGLNILLLGIFRQVIAYDLPADQCIYMLRKTHQGYLFLWDL